MNLKEYTLHSGGAIGSDYAWGYVGSLYGLENINHYYCGNPTPYGNKLITSNEYVEGVAAVVKANTTLKRVGYEKYLPLLSRNWRQVRDSEAVYAIIEKLNNPIVIGGTGWAIQMAIDHNIKDIYIFHQGANVWLKYNYKNKLFDIINTVPILKKSFAGIGTRNLKPNGLQAIIDVYNKATKELTLF